MLDYPHPQPHPYGLNSSPAPVTDPTNPTAATAAAVPPPEGVVEDNIVSASSSRSSSRGGGSPQISPREAATEDDVIASPLSVADDPRSAPPAARLPVGDAPIASDDFRGAGYSASSAWWRSERQRCANPMPVQTTPVTNASHMLLWEGSPYFSSVAAALRMHDATPPLRPTATGGCAVENGSAQHARTTPSPLPPRPLSARSSGGAPPPIPLPTTGGFGTAVQRSLELPLKANCQTHSHVYCIEERSPLVSRSQQQHQATPSPCRRAPSATSSAHSTPPTYRPPRWPSEERTMALWVDIPPSPIAPHVPTHLEQQRRRTPRGSATPSPITSTLVASFGSSVEGLPLAGCEAAGNTTVGQGSYTQSSLHVDVMASPSPPRVAEAPADCDSAQRQHLAPTPSTTMREDVGRQRLDRPPTVKHHPRHVRLNVARAPEAPVPLGVPSRASPSTLNTGCVVRDDEACPSLQLHSAQPKPVAVAVSSDPVTMAALQDTLRETQASTHEEICRLREELAQLRRQYAELSAHHHPNDSGESDGKGCHAEEIDHDESVGGGAAIDDNVVSSETASEVSEVDEEDIPRPPLQSASATLDRLLEAVRRARERAALAATASGGVPDAID